MHMPQFGHTLLVNTSALIGRLPNGGPFHGGGNAQKHGCWLCTAFPFLPSRRSFWFEMTSPPHLRTLHTLQSLLSGTISAFFVYVEQNLHLLSLCVQSTPVHPRGHRHPHDVHWPPFSHVHSCSQFCQEEPLGQPAGMNSL